MKKRIFAVLLAVVMLFTSVMPALAEETLADGTVADGAVADGTVADEALADETVEDEALAEDTVEDEALADDTVEDEALADDTVEEETLADETNDFLARLTEISVQLDEAVAAYDLDAIQSAIDAYYDVFWNASEEELEFTDAEIVDAISTDVTNAEMFLEFINDYEEFLARENDVDNNLVAADWFVMSYEMVFDDSDYVNDELREMVSNYYAGTDLKAVYERAVAICNANYTIEALNEAYARLTEALEAKDFDKIYSAFDTFSTIYYHLDDETMESAEVQAMYAEFEKADALVWFASEYDYYLENKEDPYTAYCYVTIYDMVFNDPDTFSESVVNYIDSFFAESDKPDIHESYQEAKALAETIEIPGGTGTVEDLEDAQEALAAALEGKDLESIYAAVDGVFAVLFGMADEEIEKIPEYELDNIVENTLNAYVLCVFVELYEAFLADSNEETALAYAEAYISIFEDFRSTPDGVPALINDYYEGQPLEETFEETYQRACGYLETVPTIEYTTDDLDWIYVELITAMATGNIDKIANYIYAFEGIYGSLDEAQLEEIGQENIDAMLRNVDIAKKLVVLEDAYSTLLENPSKENAQNYIDKYVEIYTEEASENEELKQWIDDYMEVTGVDFSAAHTDATKVLEAESEKDADADVDTDKDADADADKDGTSDTDKDATSGTDKEATGTDKDATSGTDKNATSTGKTSTPKTGDYANVMLWIVLMTAAGLAFVANFKKKRA